MKKLLALLLALSMLFAFVGCVDKDADDDDVRGSVVSGEKEEKEEKEEKDDKDEFSVGFIKDKVYENKYIGVGVKLPDKWRFYSDKEIQEINGIASSYYDDKTAEIMANSDVIYDMMAVNNDSTGSVNIVLEKADVSNYDFETMIAAAMPLTEQTYKNMGFTSFEYTIVEEAEISGKKVDCVAITVKNDTITVYAMQFYFECKHHIASFSISHRNVEELADIVENMYLI